MVRLFLAGCCAFIATGLASDSAAPVAPGDPRDFRRAIWGMTQEQTLATEAVAPSEVRQTGGETIVFYNAVELAGLPCRAIFIFASDKLVRAKYVFQAEHGEPNEFIGDYRIVEPRLKDAYGKPAAERAVWEDDIYQDEPKSYLEQDRASSADILPSDRFVGLSLSAGHLKLYTQWSGARTNVLHGMAGENGRITHQIEYVGVELEKFESEIRGAARTRD